MLLSSHLQLSYASELLTAWQILNNARFWIFGEKLMWYYYWTFNTSFRHWITPTPGDFNYFPCLPGQKRAVWPSAQHLKQCQWSLKFFSLHFLHLRSLLWIILPKPYRWILTDRDFSWVSISDILLSNFSNDFAKFLFDVDNSLWLWCSTAETAKTPPLFFLHLTTKFSSLFLSATAGLVTTVIRASSEFPTFR